VPVRPKRKYGTQFFLFPVASVRAPRTGETSEDGIREKPFSKEPTRAASERPRLLRIVLITAAYPTMGTPTRPNRWKYANAVHFFKGLLRKARFLWNPPESNFHAKGIRGKQVGLRSSVSTLPTTSNGLTLIDIPGTGGHLKRLNESQDTIIEPLSNPSYPISEPPVKVAPVIEVGEIREIQHTRDTQLLRALFLTASGRLSDRQSANP
jgi:hypothetical protein